MWSLGSDNGLTLSWVNSNGARVNCVVVHVVSGTDDSFVATAGYSDYVDMFGPSALYVRPLLATPKRPPSVEDDTDDDLRLSTEFQVCASVEWICIRYDCVVVPCLTYSRTLWTIHTGSHQSPIEATSSTSSFASLPVISRLYDP